MALQDTTPFWRAAIVLEIIGLVMAIIGFSVPFHCIAIFTVGTPPFEVERDVGIWQSCIAGDWDSCEPSEVYYHMSNNGPNWLKASRALTSLAWIIELVVIGLVAGTLHPRLKSKMTLYITAGLAFTSGLFGLIGVNLTFVEGKKIAKYIYEISAIAGWGYFLFLFSQITYILCAGLHIIDALKFSSEGNFQNPPEGEAGNNTESGHQPINNSDPENNSTTDPENNRTYEKTETAAHCNHPYEEVISQAQENHVYTSDPTDPTDPIYTTIQHTYTNVETNQGEDSEPLYEAVQ